MLNELESMRRGLTAAGITLETEHPDVQPVTKNKRPLLLRLNADGSLAGVELLSAGLAGHLWTFREGKHNSFPLVSLPPLLNLSSDERETFNERWKGATLADRRTILYEATAKYQTGGQHWDRWPGKGLLDCLQRKREALANIESEAAAVPAVIDSFRTMFGDENEARHAFVDALVAAIRSEIGRGIDNWLEPARNALIGKQKKDGPKTKVFGGEFYFDVTSKQFDRDVHDPRNRGAAARALSGSGSTDVGRCAITGKDVELHRGNFPQTNLPALGLSYVFSKNNDLPAAGSYGRFGPDAFPVGRLAIGDLASAVKELVREPRRNVTWCTVPGERREKAGKPLKDLLIAFVEGVPDAPTIGLLADEGDGEFDDRNVELDPVAVYERRTERLINAIEGKAPEDFRKTPVQVCLLRKVDEGNRKALLHRRVTVGQLHDCAEQWTQAQRNLPPWLFLWHKKARRRPQSLTPLNIPSLTRRQFVRGGTEATDAIGVPATEAFSLFLQEGDTRRLAQRLLHVVLRRHHQLLEATAHLEHGARLSGLDTNTALRALTLLAILLNALGRGGGSWMNEAAFRLGQLLSVADVVHAGYCADVRQGQVPPALLGNSVLSMAQTNPAKALAALARRWKPYASWAKRASAAEAARLRNSGEREEKDRGWKISQAIWQYRQAAEISTALHGQLPQAADDLFRAELLLGYVAGLPPRSKAEADDGDEREEESDGEGIV
ncbi:MAG TPA: hypothetical protein VNK52_01705 [Hyphomicrobiaceae bacterium]|nr:hypothetical protein [Hyphomicrobiaceae bacterium]